MASYNYLFRTIVVGEGGSGKSCLLIRFTDRHFKQIHDATVGAEFGTRIIRINNNKLIKLQIWDTAGQERFRSITNSFYREAVGALLVYDVTRRETFDQLNLWLKEIRERSDKNVSIILVGNKCDDTRRRQVSTTEGEEFAKENGLMMFMEASAKTGQNVDEAFKEVAEGVYKKIEVGVFNLSNVQSGIKEGDREGINLSYDGGNSVYGSAFYKFKCCSSS